MLLKGTWEAIAWLFLWMLVAAQFNFFQIFSFAVGLTATFIAFPIAGFYAFWEYQAYQARLKHKGPVHFRRSEWITFIVGAVLINVAWIVPHLHKPDVIAIALESLAFTRAIYCSMYPSKVEEAETRKKRS